MSVIVVLEIFYKNQHAGLIYSYIHSIDNSSENTISIHILLANIDCDIVIYLSEFPAAAVAAIGFFLPS